MVLYTGVESYMLEALVNNMIIAGSRKTICVTSKYIEREREPEEEGGSEGGGGYMHTTPQPTHTHTFHTHFT